MEESTQDFILQLILIIAFAGFVFIIFGGFVYLIIHTEGEDERMYSTCIDKCERIFQEQKLIECMKVCNPYESLNKTVER